jgi:hypothetical protein
MRREGTLHTWNAMNLDIILGQASFSHLDKEIKCQDAQMFSIHYTPFPCLCVPPASHLNF